LTTDAFDLKVSTEKVLLPTNRWIEGRNLKKWTKRIF
jgi:hypothetical protein